MFLKVTYLFSTKSRAHNDNDDDKLDPRQHDNARMTPFFFPLVSLGCGTAKCLLLHFLQY